jgi:hypothetical protein
VSLLDDCSAGPLKGLSYRYRCSSSEWRTSSGDQSSIRGVVQTCGQAFRAVHSIGDEPETASRYISQREELVEDIEAHHQGARRIAREAYTSLSPGPERNNKRPIVRNLCPRSQSGKLSITLGRVRLRSTPDEPEIDGKGRLLKVQTCDSAVHLSHSAALSSHSAAHLSHSAVYFSYGPAFRSATQLRCIPTTVQRI